MFYVTGSPCPDGLFSLVTAAVKAETDLQTPADIIRFPVTKTSYVVDRQIHPLLKYVVCECHIYPKKKKSWELQKLCGLPCCVCDVGYQQS